ncbi:MAG: amidohydrolase family protein [Chloroflexi bacterium]|nr:amidohydrolase family protein [Chloroflexota bacterium]
MLDLLIRNGWLADGTGNPLYPADVAIEGERIVDIGRLEGAQARRVIDAVGKIIAPGFIDAHSHTDWSIHANPLAQSTIRQGVTTEIVGNCGYSNAPLEGASRAAVEGRLRQYAYRGAIGWRSFADYLQELARLRPSCNLAFLVGHNTVRQAAGAIGPAVSEQQLTTMENLVREAMDAGALGLSTGLEFEPGRAASTEEVVRLARVVGEYGGVYASHIRNRDAYLQEAVEEFLEIVRQGGVIGEISHLNVRHNTGAPEGAWERAVETMGKARRDGLDVMADTTPFPDGIGQLAAILPPWVKAEGPARAAELLRDPAVRARLRNDCDRYWRFIHRGEWHRVRMARNERFPELAGKSFPEIAALWGQDEWECFFDILAAHGTDMDNLFVIGLLKSEELLAKMVSHPLFNLGVDGFSSSIDPSFTIPCAHPIHFAGMTHYLTYHVREKGTLRLEDAIRKMTSMPATHFGLRRRGLLCPGYCADVVVFDGDALDDVSTVEHPEAYVRGVEYVLVNGVPTVWAGEHTGARAGQSVLRS